ncbi:Anaerobic selenocysteine-containing dehydrogenase [Pedococcus dokdonensis]|uniref:Anaerobic selenocysteine-containing dehydrogenase n=1 Tax=Pedococcus dokdonensis TaxID=443156 RepID=A0A1H0M4L1_9MICO|nr:molybdopterin-dependent oxidoreductase [Pedococcus dokdonensis]SDO75241.1 Anaerobic selenocysteine-containing dehydrogenase [Pedococcus dokdonensis]
MSTAYVTCPLCEATCGLAVTLDGATVTEVRGDPDDAFSHGFICPKGASLKALHEDPDRLRRPMVKRDGAWCEASWDEAFAEIHRRLVPLVSEHGPESVAFYLGNPSSHNLGVTLYGRAFYKAVGTHNIYTAGSVDQLPKHYSSGYLFGDPLSIPVPDLDRTEHLLLLGANPLVSNGSLMTVPDAKGRLKAIRSRGGKVVVIDPKRTRTAEAADEHHAIRPGTDALLLFALLRTILHEGLAHLGRLSEHVNGFDELAALAAPFTPQAVAPLTGISATDTTRMARELAGAERAAVYGRIGTTTQEFGTLTSWLVDVLNVVTGNLDREGGAMFPLAAAGQTNSQARQGSSPPKAWRHGRWHSRVRGLPEVMGELPVATLADEILTPGAGQVRALFVVGGNPCLSTPNAQRLGEAVQTLDLMVSLDVYLNETSQHADVILPGPTPLERDHYDVTFTQLSVRNMANWSPAVLATDQPQEWQTMLRLAGIAAGQGPDADVDALDDLMAAQTAAHYQLDPSVAGARRGPARLLDIMLRGGPHDLTLADLEAAPHGVDLGPLAPRVPEVLRTPSGRIELAPEPVTRDVPRLAAALERGPSGSEHLVLIGRRQLSSNNSWMHNLAPLVRGSNTCTAQVHPDDAERLGLRHGDDAVVRSRAGSVTVPVEVTGAVRPGVVSIPHGWGHSGGDTRLRVASAHAGVNTNVLADDLFVDALSGTAALNGIPVTVEPVRREEPSWTG